MTKSDITAEQARALVDRVGQELGLLVNDNGAFLKVQGPTNKHRIYIQKSKMLNRIDFTIDLPHDDAARIPLNSPNGSVRCHIRPGLEDLERCLRMLGDGTVATQVPNKPRPFAATKGPKRTLKAMATPIPMEEISEPTEYIAEGGTLEQRLKNIHSRVRLAKINRLVEEDGLSVSEAEAVVDGKVDKSDVVDATVREQNSEARELLSEAGIEVE